MTRLSRQPRRPVAAPALLSALGLCAALGFSSCTSFVQQPFVSGLRQLLGSSTWTSGSRLTRRAEASPDVATVPSMDEAGVFMAPADPMTGELDTSGIPDGMGVYAVFDAADKLQYIGLSKQISKSVEGHAKAIGGEAFNLIASVRCIELPGETKEVLKATWERWIREHMEGGGEIPAGNLPENAPGADGRWRSRASQGKPPLNLGGVQGITSMPEAMEAVRKAITKHPVVLFMKGSPAMPQCGFSARSIGIMNSMGVDFETVNVLDEASNTGVREAVKQVSNWPTIPQLFVNGELIGGADIISEMHASGQLQAVLEGASSGGDSAPTGKGEGGSPAVGTVSLIDDPRRPVATKMSQTLSDAFSLQALQIVDESSQHEGDPGALEMGLTSESHFRVEMVAPEFEGLSAVERQKKVFSALSDVMPRVHALSLVTRTPAEVS